MQGALMGLYCMCSKWPLLETFSRVVFMALGDGFRYMRLVCGKRHVAVMNVFSMYILIMMNVRQV